MNQPIGSVTHRDHVEIDISQRFINSPRCPITDYIIEKVIKNTGEVIEEENYDEIIQVDS